MVTEQRSGWISPKQQRITEAGLNGATYPGEGAEPLTWIDLASPLHQFAGTPRWTSAALLSLLIRPAPSSVCSTQQAARCLLLQPIYRLSNRETVCESQQNYWRARRCLF